MSLESTGWGTANLAYATVLKDQEPRSVMRAGVVSPGSRGVSLRREELQLRSHDVSYALRDRVQVAFRRCPATLDNPGVPPHEEGSMDQPSESRGGIPGDVRALNTNFEIAVDQTRTNRILESLHHMSQVHPGCVDVTQTPVESRDTAAGQADQIPRIEVAVDEGDGEWFRHLVDFDEALAVLR